MGELLAGGPATAAAAGHVVPDQVADNAPTAGGGADRTQHLPVLLMVLTINKVNKNHEKNFKTQRKLIIMKNICTRRYRNELPQDILLWNKFYTLLFQIKTVETVLRCRL